MPARARTPRAPRPLHSMGALVLGLAAALGCTPKPPARPPIPPPPPAELVLTGGVVYTLDPAQPWADALAIADGTLLAVGSEAEVMRHRGPATRVVDLGGQLVLPGFHDAHVHPVTGGLELMQCDLNEVATLPQLRTTIQSCAEAQAGQPWLQGGGWSLTMFTDGNPDRQWLDALVPDVPVYLTAADGHSAWLNTEGLRQAGITAQTPDPPNGRIERDAAGDPSGTLREEAMKLASALLPPPTSAEYDEGLRRGLAMAHGFGITSLHEANASPPILAAYERLAASGRLRTRVVAAQSIDPLQGPDQLDAIVARRDAIDHPHLRASAIKIFADGVIEAGTAALLRPYEGRETAGHPTLPPERLDAIITRADALGLDVHVHAIGDRAIRITLDAFESAARHNPPRSRRNVIAHLELIDPADIPRFEALDVVASFQPLWAYADTYITDLTIPVLGPERSRWLYPIASVMATGATVVAGSDWSVSSMNPLHGIEVALTRRGVTEPPGGPVFIPEEQVTLPPMLAAYTREGVWLDRWEDVTGTITAGKRADLAILEKDLFELAAHEIAEVQIATTMFEGEVVHAGPGNRVSAVR